MTAMSNTFVYTIMTLIILIPIPLALSAMLDRGRTYKPMAWRIALFVPALASLVVVSFLFRVILGENGLLNSFLVDPRPVAPGVAHICLPGHPIPPHHRDVALGRGQHALFQQWAREYLARAV